MIWITVLFGLLSLLVQWWLSRSKSGKAPTEKHIRDTERVLGYLEKVKECARSMGISLQPMPPSESFSEAASGNGNVVWADDGTPAAVRQFIAAMEEPGWTPG